MKYVYILKSQKGNKVYTGNADDVDERFERHNAGRVASIKERRPWRMICYIAFEDKQTAYDFERYLKSGSGRAFIAKHFV